MSNFNTSVFLVVCAVYSHALAINEPVSPKTNNPNEFSILNNEISADLRFNQENKNFSCELAAIPDKKNKEEPAPQKNWLKKLVAKVARHKLTKGFSATVFAITAAILPLKNKVVASWVKSMFSPEKYSGKDDASVGALKFYSFLNIANEVKSRISGRVQIIGKNIRLASATMVGLFNIGNELESTVEGNIEIITSNGFNAYSDALNAMRKP